MPATPATNPLLLLLGVLSAGVVASALTGTRLPLIGTFRSALIALIILGMSMCSLGIQAMTCGWLNPFNVAGVILGVLALGLAVAVLAGIGVPYLHSDGAAIMALGLIMAVKVILALLRGLLAPDDGEADGLRNPSPGPPGRILVGLLCRTVLPQPAQPGESVLSGSLPDQAALHGGLARIRDLNLN